MVETHRIERSVQSEDCVLETRINNFSFSDTLPHYSFQAQKIKNAEFCSSDENVSRLQFKITRLISTQKHSVKLCQPKVVALKLHVSF